MILSLRIDDPSLFKIFPSLFVERFFARYPKKANKVACSTGLKNTHVKSKVFKERTWYAEAIKAVHTDSHKPFAKSLLFKLNNVLI